MFFVIDVFIIMCSERLTVSRDEGFVLGLESRIHVGVVGLEPDGHLGAFYGDDAALFLSTEPSGRGFMFR